ncbi:MAG: acyltransferase [Candidatus Eisenbacteria bacterium]|nr:acyltransferase [Candidatus Eisenbacteria bacterium]
MRVGWIQTEPVYGDTRANLRQVESVVQSREADLWVLPELFATGYLFGGRAELSRLAEAIPAGPTTQEMIRLSRSAGCAFVAGIAEGAPSGMIFNAAIAVDPAGLRALYRKIHLFDLEKEWFDPGDTAYPVVSIAGARVGMMICFDWRFPEAARSLALAGAQIIAHPANLVHAHCQNAMVTRAIENGVFTVTANRTGAESRGDASLVFTGRSRIVAPDGRILSDGPAQEPACDVVELDPTAADDKRVTPRNDLLGDRRPAFYRSGPGA